MIRVFFWFAGVNPLRYKGPWWWREFEDEIWRSAETKAQEFEKALGPICYRIQRQTPTTHTQGLPEAWQPETPEV